MEVIQVGMGGMGDVWLRTIIESPNVEHAAFVETNQSIAETQAGRYDLDPATIFPSLDKALASTSADGVIDVTPPQFHQSVSTTALEAGIPVLSEKPLANSMEAAQTIVQKANETGVLHVVSQNYRYRPSIQTVKQIIDSGELGRIAAVNVEFFKEVHFDGFRAEMPHPLIVDMSIHHFDLIRFFLDSDPISIFAKSWNPEWSTFKGDASASVLLTFENKVEVAYSGSWCSKGEATPWNGNWRFDCEKGVITLEQDKVFIHQADKEARLIETVEMTRQDQAYALHQFFSAVSGGGIPPTTCHDNIKSLSIVFGAIKSIETGQIVQLT